MIAGVSERIKSECKCRLLEYRFFLVNAENDTKDKTTESRQKVLHNIKFDLKNSNNHEVLFFYIGSCLLLIWSPLDSAGSKTSSKGPLSPSLKKIQYFLEGRKREDPGNEFGVCSGRGYCVVFLVQGPSPTSTSLHPVVKMDTDKL